MLKPHIPRVARGAALTLAITAVGCTFSGQAVAETTVGAFKGVPTLDGLPTSSVYSYDDNVATRTEVVRAGTAIDQALPTFDLVPGDSIQVYNRATGALMTQALFDGAPLLGASTCVGSAGMYGLRNPAGSVGNVYAYKRAAMISSEYGDYRPQEDLIRGTVLATAGRGFAGAFRKVIPAGHVLHASQTILLSETASYDVAVERLVTDCPPAPAPALAPDLTGPSGQFILSKFLRKSSLVRGKVGRTVNADISEAGSVKVAVYADNGAKLTDSNPEFVLIAGGENAKTSAGRLRIKLKATKVGREAMKGDKRVKAIVVATLTDTAGNIARLQMKKITIR